MVIGVLVGLLAAYFGGWVDTLIGRVIDVVVAFPFLVLVIAIVAMLGPGLTNFFIAVTHRELGRLRPRSSGLRPSSR